MSHCAAAHGRNRAAVHRHAGRAANCSGYGGILAWRAVRVRGHRITMQDNQKPAASGTADLQREVAELMIGCLNLEVTADQITPDASWCDEGLGLDSIDVLEVALEISGRYCLQLRSDS